MIYPILTGNAHNEISRNISCYAYRKYYRKYIKYNNIYTLRVCLNFNWTIRHFYNMGLSSLTDFTNMQAQTIRNIMFDPNYSIRLTLYSDP